MNTLLQNQLQQAFGKDFKLDKTSKEFQTFLQLIQDSYENYEETTKALSSTLQNSAQKLKQTNQLLMQQKELLKNVENSMEDAVFYKDLDFKYIGCNQKFAEFLQTPESEIIGKTDYDFFDVDTAKEYEKSNKLMLKEKKKIVYKHWLNYKGKKIYLMTSKTLLLNDNGEVVGIVGISRDITNEYKLQQDIEHKNIMLIQQNKLVSMGEMIANIAHQWRQPLNSLNLLMYKTQLYYHKGMLSEENLDKNIADSLLLIQEMSQTIDDFRNFFKPNRVLENFPLHEVIYKAYTIIHSRLETNHIKCNINIHKEHFINGYKNELFQVILNLLNNSVDALCSKKIQKPLIEISVKEKDQKIVLEIVDNAKGIPKEIIDKIFDPYFTTKDKGTGLGLYMSKIIIESHMKGRLSLKNTKEGSLFTIELTKD